MDSSTGRCALLADRHHGLSEGIRTLLETSFDWVVMVADATSLLESAVKLRPEMAVVDVSLCRDCLTLLQQLREKVPEVKLILMSVHDEPALVRALMKAGADGFVLKRTAGLDLLRAVEAIRAGNRFISPATKDALGEENEGPR